MGLFGKNKPESKELAVSTPREVAIPVTDEMINQYLRTFGIGLELNDDELTIFRTIAKSKNLNPIEGDIYPVAYGEGKKRALAILTGYQTYIKKAELSGLLETWSVEEAPISVSREEHWATITIKRKDKPEAQKWTVYYSEVVQVTSYGKPNKNWATKYRFMTKKVVIAQGFRLFFQDVFHGIPYASAEKPIHEEINVTPEPQPVAQGVVHIKATPPLQEMMDAEDPSVGQDQSAPVLPPEKTEDPVVETQAPDIDYFKQIIELVNKTKDLSGSVKAETMGKAMEHKNDPALLKDIFDDLVRGING